MADPFINLTVALIRRHRFEPAFASAHADSGPSQAETQRTATLRPVPAVDPTPVSSDSSAYDITVSPTFDGSFPGIGFPEPAAGDGSFDAITEPTPGDAESDGDDPPAVEPPVILVRRPAQHDVGGHLDVQG